MNCSSCAAENPADARFCENCGSPLSLACPECGKPVSPGAKFCRHCGTALAAPVPTTSPKPASVYGLSHSQNSQLSTLQKSAPLALQEKMRLASAQIEGERKPVTILFTDIVSSTSHAEHLDPEDWREIVSQAHNIVSAAVYHYEGTIAQLLGDGVMAFFGAPITHEDDPLLAVHAALDIQAEMATFALQVARDVPNFQVRVGINTGTVVVGAVGHNMHMEYLAIGDAVNLAARLQSAAEPGEILISDQTRRFVQHAVDLQDLGEVRLKGKADAVRIYQVEGLKPVPERGRGLREGESLLVGRGEELAALLQASSAVQSGLGRVAVLAGEPGIGKSRLLAEWRCAGGEGLHWVEAATLSYGHGLPYHLLFSLLRSLLGASPGYDEAELKRLLAERVTGLFGAQDIETAAFLGHLLSLPLDAEAEQVVRGLDPLTLCTQYIAALRRLLLALAERQPLAVIFEDIHWADQASVDVLLQLLPLARQASLLFVYTTRTEQSSPGWSLVTAARNLMGAGLIEINLHPLSNSEVKQMAANLLAADDLPSGLQALIVEKAEGNPLFIEEIISALIEDGVLERQNGRLVAVGDPAQADIPDNLKRLVLARIDRLADEPKHTLRVASVLGREFLVRLLDAVLAGAGQSESRARLLDQLSDLEATSLIQLSVTRPDIGYLFRHALVQEAAYEAVLKADRRHLHQAAAQALERLYPERLDELAATLAYHFARAEDHQHSLVYLERAADGARQKYANAEAIALYRAAIEQAVALRQTDEGSEERLAELYEKLGSVQVLAGLHEAGLASFDQALAFTPPGQALAAARRHRQIGNGWMLPREYAKALQAFDQAAQVIGERPAEPDLLWLKEWLDLQLDRLWALYWMNDIPRMDQAIQLIKPDIEAAGDASQRSVFYGRLVTLAFRRDRYVISDETLRNAQLARRYAEQSAQQTGELTNLMLSPFILAFTYLWRGDFALAETNFTDALELAERTGNQEQRVLVLGYHSLMLRLMHDVKGAQEFVPRALQAAQEARMPVYIGMALANQAWISLQQGELARAEADARAAQAYLPVVFPNYGVVAWPLIHIHLGRGDVTEAIELARNLIHPSQRKLTEPLENALISALQSFDAGDVSGAGERLAQAERLADEQREGVPIA